MAVKIVRPGAGDEAGMSRLLDQLGYPSAPATLRERIDQLDETANNPVFVAIDRQQLQGLIGLHWTETLFTPAPVARITVLVVAEEARGRGIGRQLVEAGIDIAREAGCRTIEVTTALPRCDAQNFYRASGFSETSLRYAREI